MVLWKQDFVVVVVIKAINSAELAMAKASSSHCSERELPNLATEIP